MGDRGAFFVGDEGWAFAAYVFELAEGWNTPNRSLPASPMPSKRPSSSETAPWLLPG
jgi:hypothetical protein